MPADRRKKKTRTKYGSIEINKAHPFSKGAGGFQLSPLLQELMVYIGPLDSYPKGPEIIQKSLGIEVGHSQIHRVSATYYVGVDGSMILTREDGWKEVKVGRVFKSSDCLDPNGKQSWIKHSQYVAHLGNHHPFTRKMDTLIESYGGLGHRLVFISDGAPWIRNWIEDTFPEAVSILDYYHAVEHLYEFTDSYFTDKKEAENWAKRQTDLLLSSQVRQVISHIETLAPQQEEAKKLMAYYSVNQGRMDYRRYRQIGCGIIGSGAIESAHRVVVQKRMKQSGQRWSRRGAQHMLNLRVTYENEKWETIINLIKTNPRAKKHKKAA